jgi:hypothetical protein
LEKIVEKGYWSVIANTGTVVFLRTGTITDSFYKVGNNAEVILD